LISAADRATCRSHGRQVRGRMLVASTRRPCRIARRRSSVVNAAASALTVTCAAVSAPLRHDPSTTRGRIPTKFRAGTPMIAPQIEQGRLLRVIQVLVSEKLLIRPRMH